jgi:uncharacterized protein (DUF4213/DUF364 family)
MSIVEQLLASLPAEAVALRDVRIGPFWTVVWSERGAGLASTQHAAHSEHGHRGVGWAGDLLQHSAQEVAALLRSDSPLEASLGMAAVNALLPVDETTLTDRNAGEEIMQRGKGKRVVIVGHFPFILQVRRAVGHLDVLELHPGPGDLPASAAVDVIPEADVVAITGTALLNRTFESLVELCYPEAFVLVLGPTTPLSALLFACGVNLLAGTVVTDPRAALTSASQGAIFPQMRGVRLVTMLRP